MIESEVQITPSPFGVYVVWFMRCVAVAWLAKGVLHWTMLLGIGPDWMGPFDTLATRTQTAIVFFAVIDLVAAVGLWMASAWGGVTWIMAAGAFMALEILFPPIFGRQYWLLFTFAALILVYFLLMYLASRAGAD